MSNGRAKGKIKFFNTDKGFGFAERDAGQGDVFVHANELRRSGIDAPLKKDDVIEFDLVPVAGKAPKAANIKRV
jgi:CspA family cold shock protein